MRDVREVVREGPWRRREILDALADGPRRVGEIAAAIGAPEREAMFWVMDMRRYGYVSELGPDDEGRFLYQATEKGVGG